MKKHVRFLALLLIAALLLPACSNGDPVETAGSPTAGEFGETTPAETETTLDPNLRKNHFDNLPAELNYDGATVHCLFHGESTYLDGTKSSYWVVNDIVGTNNIGDIISDAVWERNNTVSERLGVELKWTASDGKATDKDREVFKSAVMSGDNTFHYFLPIGATGSQAGMAAYMKDLSKLENLDLSQPWWWQFANDAMSLDGQTNYFIVGDMLLTNLAQTCITYFNKQMYTDIFGDPNELYKLVLDGKFTLDVLSEYVAQAYKDVDGDGARSEGDTYGLLWSAKKTEELAGYIVSCDPDMYTRDSSGALTITMNNDRTLTTVTKLSELLHNNPGSYIGKENSSNAQRKLFAADKGLFWTGRLFSATTAEMRDMKSDYGIIPVPKLDEAQESYLSGVHVSGNSLCIPKNTGDAETEMAAAVIEALCGEAHRSYMDTYFDTVLKVKYSRDELSGQCIDLILNGLAKNTLDEYDVYCNGIIWNCITVQIRDNLGTFASAVSERVSAAQAKWDKSVAELTQ